MSFYSRESMQQAAVCRDGSSNCLPSSADQMDLQVRCYFLQKFFLLLGRPITKSMCFCGVGGITLLKSTAARTHCTDVHNRPHNWIVEPKHQHICGELSCKTPLTLWACGAASHPPSTQQGSWSANMISKCRDLITRWVQCLTKVQSPKVSDFADAIGEIILWQHVFFLSLLTAHLHGNPHGRDIAFNTPTWTLYQLNDTGNEYSMSL